MSNRSPHFVHRLQTLPSALAGVPGSRRLLALAVVFALLTLTLLPTTGQAQTYQTEDDPRVPRNLSAQVEVGGVALRWLPPAEDAASVDGYEILRGRPNQGEGTLMTLVSDTGGTDTTYFDATAVASGARYTYRVKAIRNGVRSDWSNVSQVLRPPAAPPPPPPLVSNTGQSDVSAATITHQYAQGFRLGKHGQGYKISSVSIELAQAPSDLTVSLWIGSHPGHLYGGTARRKLFDFENPDSFAVGLNQFTAPAGAFAYPNVNYFIVLSDFGSSLQVKETMSDAEDTGGETEAVIFDRACLRALSKTGFWSGSCSRGSVLRLAVEGSKRDSGILASTFGQTWDSNQEIISVGDDCCFEFRVESAGRYLIRGLSIVADDTATHGGFFGLPFELQDDSGNKLFTLTHASAQGDLVEPPRHLTAPAGISSWVARGATVAGGCPTVTETETVTDEDGNEAVVETEVVRCKSYKLDMHIDSIDGDDQGRTRGGVLLTRIFGTLSGAHDAQRYDTPAAAGVTFGGTADIAIGAPFMAIDGEPLYAMVQNLEQANNGYVSLGSEDFKALTQSFTTGFSSYRLQGIGINIEGSDDTDGNPQVPGGPSSVSVAVHISKAGAVGAKLFDLVSPDEFVPGHSFFEAPPGTLLLPRTKYVVVWSYLGGTWHRLQRTSSTDEDSGAQPGFRIDNSLLAGDSPASVSVHSSGDALEMAVYGEPVSETTMVSNLGQSDNGYVSLGGSDSKALTQSFRTGSGSYRLLGIGINIEGSDDTDGNPQVPDGPSSVSVVVRTGDSDVELVSPDEFELGLNLFEAPRGTFLEPSTTYTLVWSYLGGTWHRLQKTLSGNQDSGSLQGFTIGDAFRLGASPTSTAEDTVEDVDGNALEIALYGAVIGAPRFLEGSYQVGKDWFHLPDGVVVGDQFRLVFITQDHTDATSGDIEYYNALVQEEAAREYNHKIIRGAAPEFKAVVCTADVDARTYTEITEALGAPIHWLDGGWDDRPTLIANSHYDFFSPEWINTEWGAIAPGNSTFNFENRYVWTGCDFNGVARAEAHMGTTSDMRIVAVGTPGDPRREFAPLGSERHRLGYPAAEIDERHQIYAISPVFTVVAFP